MVVRLCWAEMVVRLDRIMTVPVRGRKENGRTGDDGRTGDNSKTNDRSTAVGKGPGFSTNVKRFKEKALQITTCSVSAMFLNLIK